MTDITIPAEDAKRLADALRHKTIDPGREQRLRWADLLDPTAPSLRDEVLDEVQKHPYHDALAVTDAILAVVRRHVEGLPHPAATPAAVYMDDVLRLLGAGDE